MCDCNVLKSTAVAISGTTVIITIPTTTFTTPDTFNLVIAQTLPTLGYGYPVIINNNGQFINLLDKMGNYVIAGELRPRKCYKIYYNDFPSHMTVISQIDHICPKTSSTVGVTEDDVLNSLKTNLDKININSDIE